MERRVRRSLHVSRHGREKKNCPVHGNLAIQESDGTCGDRSRNRKKCAMNQENIGPDSTALHSLRR